jgi:hypothetical protein
MYPNNVLYSAEIHKHVLHWTSIQFSVMYSGKFDLLTESVIENTHP